MKVLIFDSGALINLSMNGLLDILEKLKASFQGKFVITEAVKYETCDRPIGIERFELGALRIQSLISKGTLELPSSLNIDKKELNKETFEIMNIANRSLQTTNQFIKIVREDEMSCLALSKILSKQGIETLIAIDERTTRILSEKPENLEKIMSEKLHIPVRPATKNFSAFSGFRYIRSSELVYVAFKKGLTDVQGPKALEALLYATKFKGSSISFEEINELKKL